MLCEFTSILRIKFRLHSRSMRPYNRIALRRKSLRSSFVSWLGHCRFGTFHRGQQFLVSLHTFPEIKKMKRKKLIHRLCMEWKHNLQKNVLKINKLLEFFAFFTFRTSCGLTMSSWARTVGKRAAFKNDTNNAIFELSLRLHDLWRQK